VNIFKMPVHPAAAVFPMLPDDELDALAADITEHGLRYPLIVKDEHLIDGRNRREACRRAGIEPQVAELNGDDPVAYIVSTNINRRNMTRGQRAMALAKLYPEPEKGGRGKKVSVTEGFSSGKLSEARTVLACLPEAADAVLVGTKSLSDAYAEAIKVREDLDSETRRLERLRQRAPDLADLVDDSRMRLTEAESAYETRQEAARRERLAVLAMLDGMERLLDAVATGKRRANVVAHLTQADDRKRAQTLCRAWIKNLTETLEAL
jgi:hypothetical protein